MTSKFGLNPWSTIWTQPRKTIRAIAENDPKYHFFYLAAIYGLQTLFFLMYVFAASSKYNIISLLITCIIISPFLGAIFIYYNSWVLYFSGKWFKGSASFTNVKAALAWSKVPNIIPLLMWFILLTFSTEIITSSTEQATVIFIDLIVLISGIWSFVILLKALEEVQGFSIWRSFSNIIVAFLISAIILFLLRVVISYLIIFFKS